MAPLTDSNERETRTISSHRTVIRKAHRLLGQKMDLRYPRANKDFKPIHPQEELKIAAVVRAVIRKYI